MGQLQRVFNYKENTVRTVAEGEGLYFVAKDVCNVLGIRNHSDAVSRLSPKQKSVLGVSDPQGRIQDTVVLTEPGVYKLVFRSNKPEAEKFTDWIAEEVLPSIRTHGAYVTDDLLEKTLSDPDYMIGVLEKIKEERSMRLAAEKINQDNKPKVIFAEALETSSTSILIGEMARLLRQNGINVGQNRLFALLRNEGYLIKRRGESFNSPTQRSMDMGLMEIKKSVINTPNGPAKTTTTSKVTGKGQLYFVNKFLEGSIEV